MSLIKRIQLILTGKRSFVNFVEAAEESKENLQNPDLYCHALRAIVLRYRSSPAQASLPVLEQYLRTAYGLAVQLRKTEKN